MNIQIKLISEHTLATEDFTGRVTLVLANNCLYKGVYSYEFGEFAYFTFTHPNEILFRL